MVHEILWMEAKLKMPRYELRWSVQVVHGQEGERVCRINFRETVRITTTMNK